MRKILNDLENEYSNVKQVFEIFPLLFILKFKSKNIQKKKKYHLTINKFKLKYSKSIFIEII